MQLAEREVLCHQPPHQTECLSCIALCGLRSFIPPSSLIPGAHQDLRQTCQEPEIIVQ